MFKLSSIPNDKSRGWTVKIDGQEVTVGKIEITSRFGELSYGLRPEGYDAWVFQEDGGGGSITIPYSTDPSGEIFVGLVREQRANMGSEPVWCAIGGFIKPAESHDDAQIRETAEEAGLEASFARLLEGVPANSNRAFFVADPAKDEGVHAYGLELPWSALKQDGDSYELKNTMFLPGFKKAESVRFFPWRLAIQDHADVLARGGIGQLIAELK